MTLEHRVRMDRRKASDAYIRSILEARSGRDRRSDIQRLKDNAFITNWMTSFQEARS